MSAYLIVNYDVEDADLYGEYQVGAGSALGFDAGTELLVLDAETAQVEGDGAGKQTVVLKFPSMERAREVYESGDYQAIIPKRHAATSKHFALLVNGLG